MANRARRVYDRVCQRIYSRFERTTAWRKVINNPRTQRIAYFMRISRRFNIAQPLPAILHPSFISTDDVGRVYKNWH